MKSGRRQPDRKQKVTLTEVAKMSGVSEITVSRVLRNNGPVSTQTREKVLEAVKQTGYVPNRLAGSLASADSNLMGVVIPSLSNIVFPEVLRGIHSALGPTGIQPVVGITDYNMEIEEQLVRSLLAWKPQAMLIVGFDHTDATRQMLRNSGVRVAELMDIDSEAIDIAVGMSHRGAGYDTGRHLLERGYRKFGYVGHDWLSDRRARLRFDGLCDALNRSGLSLVDQELFQGPSSTMAGRQALQALLTRTPGIDAVVFSNDDMAIGGVFHCLAQNIALKDDLAIFGFNGLEIGGALPQPLSTIRSHRFEIGRTAVEKILETPVQHGAPATINTGYEIVVGATA
ncbi:LacI family DNA-binding transcriptional regulator [Oricola nitratireducens]|jgi:LacI family gluconate utilization system Gnt-I transcriptional repressor|uniref:LacI family DNA-binding transcriptional regulator n=1 Tax=Oricola nitratireducens TaxID=2775868 RepID=UPI001867A329|nr:LacI family DNA-binding transcriptional regulator [Oricola nitratireducens]